MGGRCANCLNRKGRFFCCRRRPTNKIRKVFCFRTGFDRAGIKNLVSSPLGITWTGNGSAVSAIFRNPFEFATIAILFFKTVRRMGRRKRWRKLSEGSAPGTSPPRREIMYGTPHIHRPSRPIGPHGMEKKTMAPSTRWVRMRVGANTSPAARKEAISFTSLRSILRRRLGMR